MGMSVFIQCFITCASPMYVEIEGYSIMYFNRITMFEAPYH